MKPFRQGDFNGLCGLYAVLNAIQHNLEVPGQRDLHDELFRVAACAIPRIRFPEVLWDGMAIDDLFRITTAVTRHLEDKLRFEFEVWKPFETRSFADVAAYLAEMAELWSSSKVSFVLGVNWAGNSGGHWTVLRSIATDEIGILDSGECRSLSRRALTLTSAPNKHRLCPRETVAFRLTGIDGESVYAGD